VLVLAGLPRPVAQHRVRDAGGRLIATLDLAYPEESVAIEYEGEDHFTDERGRRDVYRYTRLVDLGWHVYRYIAPDVYIHPDRIVTDIARALRLRPRHSLLP
jgi:very-short-patch-repair endonuclease